MKEGFIIGNGDYSAIPFGNQLMIIYKGEQLKVCRTEQSARSFISDHKKQILKSSTPIKKSSTKQPNQSKQTVKSNGKQSRSNGRTSK